jgi:chromosome partitioning protein
MTPEGNTQENGELEVRCLKATSPLDPHANPPENRRRRQPKGGVGKTTTAVNLAASVAAAEKRTLIIDADPQGNASSGVGIKPRTLKRSLYEALIVKATLDEVIVKTDIATLDIIPATQDLAGAEIEFVELPDRAERLRKMLTALKMPQEGGYEYVFIDCPPSLGLLTLNALVAADRVIVPLQCEYYALEGLTHLMATIDRIKGAYNANLAVEGIVLTMFDPRNNLSHEVAGEVRRHFHVFDAIIPRNVRLSEAPSHGLPILLYDAQSKGAQGYLSLAREVIEAAER